MKVYVINGGYYHTRWIEGAEFTNIYDNADIVMFTGGADVTPTLYHENIRSETRCSGKRDAEEIRWFLRALHDGKGFIGICRGSQFLTVMSGGRLIQHVDNHAISGVHEITSEKFGDTAITSTHHQMMFPYDLPDEKYELIAWSKQKLSTEYCFYGEVLMPKDFIEPEIVWYPHTRALCIQGHPEQMNQKEPAIKYCSKIVNHYHKQKKNG